MAIRRRDSAHGPQGPAHETEAPANLPAPSGAARATARPRPLSELLGLEDRLRPPLLRFDGDTRTNGPRFEEQAIASLRALKVSTPAEVIDILARTITIHGPDIGRNGSPRALQGLDDIQAFLGLNMVFGAMKQGTRR